MKIIDAVWEERNLGVSTYEIKIEFQDMLEDVSKKYSELTEKQYMVVRIPSSCHWAVPFFQSKGYSFIEAAVTLRHDLKNIPVSLGLKKLFDRCSYDEMDDNDIEVMYNEIDKGIFKTDRIYLDSAFRKGVSAQRYKHWIADMISQGKVSQKVTYNNEAIGFFVNSETKNGVYDGILAGVYSNFEGSGLGVCIQYMGLIYCMNNGAKRYIGHVSANNIVVLKALLSLDFKITDIEYVLIKHN
jgi:hypothetical protein